jgi:hypothetical protein
MRAFAVFAVLASLATPAAAFRATNGLTVESTGPKDFTVNYRANRAVVDYWCAAGDYLIRDLGLSPKTRLYRASPKPGPVGQGIAFTLDPAGAAPGAGLSTFNSRDDESVSAGHARAALCQTYKPLFRFD